MLFFLLPIIAADQGLGAIADAVENGVGHQGHIGHHAISRYPHIARQSQDDKVEYSRSHA